VVAIPQALLTISSTDVARHVVIVLVAKTIGADLPHASTMTVTAVVLLEELVVPVVPLMSTLLPDRDIPRTRTMLVALLHPVVAVLPMRIRTPMDMVAAVHHMPAVHRLLADPAALAVRHTMVMTVRVTGK
jgi:hypothetical protein